MVQVRAEDDRTYILEHMSVFLMMTLLQSHWNTSVLVSIGCTIRMIRSTAKGFTSMRSLSS